MKIESDDEYLQLLDRLMELGGSEGSASDKAERKSIHKAMMDWEDKTGRNYEPDPPLRPYYGQGTVTPKLYGFDNWRTESGNAFADPNNPFDCPR